ncbi:TPA: hypothetical protein VW698_000548 [Streptococcus pneumoniae]|nr:hypothetical protein [Streptococcus pneumoniae]
MSKLILNLKLNSFLFVIILLLVVVTPTHTLIFDALIPTKIDNLWREFLLVISFLCILKINAGKIKIGKLGGPIIVMGGIGLVYTICSDRPFTALNLFRIYMFPAVIYFIIINCNFRKERLLILKQAHVYTACILALWGIFQAWVLKDQFLIKIGYPSQGNFLKSTAFYIGGFFGQQRVTSTFSAPNLAGVYFGISLIILLSIFDTIKSNRLVLFSIVAAFVLTFSRSAIISTLVGIVFFQRKKLFSTTKINVMTLVIFPLIFLIVLVIFYLYPENVIINMLYSSYSSTLNLTDSSVVKHLEDLWLPLLKVIDYPLGLGFGNNGPIVLSLYHSANLVESSIYLLAYDFGILGMFIYLFPYFYTIFVYKKYLLSGAICCLVLITYLFLPNVENFEIIFFIYLFIGMDELALYTKGMNVHEID